jgi:hypothetical protein
LEGVKMLRAGDIVKCHDEEDFEQTCEDLEAVGACLKVYSSFVALRYRYDCLEASLKIIQEKNLEGLKLVKAIEEQYEKAEPDFKYSYAKEVQKLNSMLEQVPQEYWL